MKKRLFLIGLFTVFLAAFVSQDTFAASKVHFIATGFSNAILIESDGHYGLIDASNPSAARIKNSECGPECSDSATNVDAVINYLNKLGVNKLDFVVTSHNHSDHVGGMPEIASRFVSSQTTYYYRGCMRTQEDERDSNNKVTASGAHKEWLNYDYCLDAENAMRNAGANMYNFTSKPKISSFQFGSGRVNFYNIYRSAGSVAETEENCNNEAVNNGVWKSVSGVGLNRCNENYNSVIVKFTDENNKKYLLLGDTQTAQDSDIMKLDVDTDVLQAGHHGYLNATSTAFINRVSPSIIIVPTGAITNKNNGSGGSLDIAKNNGITVKATGNASSNSAGALVLNSNSKGTIFINGVSPNGEQDTPSDGWVQQGNALYYYQNGELLRNTYTPDGYYVGADGAWDGKPARSPDQGQVGATFNDWAKVGDDWYYYDESGNMIKSQWREINGVYYFFYEDGKMLKGWAERDGFWYYYGDDGYMVRSDWRKINGVWYFFQEDGKMLTGWIRRDGNYYYYDRNGNILKDTRTPDGFYVGKNGVWDGKPAEDLSGNGPDKEDLVAPKDARETGVYAQDAASSPAGGTPGDTPSGETPSDTPSDTPVSGSGPSYTLNEAEEGECAALLTWMCNSSGDDIMSIIQLVIAILTAGVLVAGTIGVIACGRTIMMARDNAAELAKAKKRLFEIVIGIVLWVLAAIIVSLLIPNADTSTLSVVLLNLL